MQLGQNQRGLASQVPGLYAQDISTLGSAGAIQQAQEQAGLDATRERNRLRAYEPYEGLGFQQTGLAGIGQQAAMSGNLGGGREGVMRAQFKNKSDMNRALLQSGLLQQGFTQALSLIHI